MRAFFCLGEIDMKVEELKEVLRLHSLYLSRDKNGRKADLSGANLREANLYGANLYRADLSGASLSRAYLYRATWIVTGKP